MCSGTGRQKWQKQRQRKGRQQSTKKWQQKCSNITLNVILNITWLRRKEQEAAVCGCDNSCNGVGSQQWQARGQATVAKAKAAQGQTTINQKAIAIPAKTVLLAAETVVAMSVAAAVPTAAMVAMTRQPWQW